MLLIKAYLLQIVVSLTVLSPGEVHIDNFGKSFFYFKDLAIFKNVEYSKGIQ
jgi:hypothetical protein